MSMLPSALVTGLVVVAVMPYGIRALRRFDVVDRPNDRSSHQEPTPRGGGLVIAPALVAGLAVASGGVSRPLAVACFVVSAIGAWEDVRGVPIGLRLAGQAGAVTVFLVLTREEGRSLAVAAVVLLLVGAVAYINAFNFMDGVNGISAASAACAGLAFFLSTPDGDVRVASAVVGTAALCFLPFNFPRAQVFLGDSGSYGFGIVIACAGIAAWRAGAPAEAVLAPLGPYAADTAWTLLRRARNQEPLLSPHRQHVYQRLAAAGQGHGGATATVTVVTLACTVLTAVGTRSAVPLRVAADLGAVVVLAGYLAIPERLAPAEQHTAT